MTPIEDTQDADTTQHQLEDAINNAIFALKQAQHRHRDLDHGDGSAYTDRAMDHIGAVVAAEARLVDYQARAELYPVENLEEA